MVRKSTNHEVIGWLGYSNYIQIFEKCSDPKCSCHNPNSKMAKDIQKALANLKK